MIEGRRFRAFESLAPLLNSHNLLLYPSKEAVDIETIEIKEPRTLFVLDGTWEYARNMYDGNRDLLAPLTKVWIFFFFFFFFFFLLYSYSFYFN